MTPLALTCLPQWKCNALNGPSRAAAVRLGFQLEGVFRQAAVIKGRNRDTAWHSITDKEWPLFEQEFVRWLAPENFDAQGRERSKLRCAELRRGFLQQQDVDERLRVPSSSVCASNL